MLKPKQQRCLELMLTGKMTDKEIAKAINVMQGERIHKKVNPFFVIWYCNLLIITI